MISIIIPTYKRSDFLKSCIDSVLNQTYKDIEVIVVDDNNPNTEWRYETEKLMQQYQDNKKVLYLLHEKNKNGSAARNTGIKNSRGEYLCFLDDDDIYYPTKLEEQLNFMKNNPWMDACFCDYRNSKRNIRLNYKPNYITDILLNKTTPQTSGWLIKKSVVELLNGFDESYFRHQDYEFLLRFFNAGFVMGKVDEVLYCRKKTEINNEPNGMKQEQIKEKLLHDFSFIISRFSNNFQKRIFITNYIFVFNGFLKNMDIKNMMRILFIILSKNTPLAMILLVKFYYKRILFKTLISFSNYFK